MLIYFTGHQSNEPRGDRIGNLVRQSVEYWIRLRYPCIPPVITLQHRTKWWSDLTFSEIIGSILIILWWSCIPPIITTQSRVVIRSKVQCDSRLLMHDYVFHQSLQRRATWWSSRKFRLTTECWWSCTPPEYLETQHSTAWLSGRRFSQWEESQDFELHAKFCTETWSTTMNCG